MIGATLVCLTIASVVLLSAGTFGIVRWYCERRCS